MTLNARRGRQLKRIVFMSAVLAIGVGALGQEMDPTVDQPAPVRPDAFEQQVGELASPSAVAIAPDGTILVLEADTHQISAFDRAGNRLRQWGARGGGPGELLAPQDIAIAEDGTIFVADTGNHRVQVFSADGAALRSFGSVGTDPGQFNEPRGIAVDDRRVYVADSGNQRVQVFNHAGEVELVLKGAEGQPFMLPVDVARDSYGSIYVLDADTSMIHRLSAAGEPAYAWGGWGTFPGMCAAPMSLSCFGDVLYVSDTRNHRIQAFDTLGNPLVQWGLPVIVPHEGDGKIHYPDDFAIAPDGSFAVVCESIENRFQVFSTVLMSTPMAPAPPPATSGTHYGGRITCAADIMAVFDPDVHRIEIYNTTRPDAILIHKFGEFGSKFGQFNRIDEIMLSADSKRLYVVDNANRRIQAFKLDREPGDKLRFILRLSALERSYSLDDLVELGADAPELTWPIRIVAMRPHASGEIYALDARNAAVLVFDQNLKLKRWWGGHGDGDGRFNRPTDLAFSPDGDVLYIVDSLNRRIQRCSPKGDSLGSVPLAKNLQPVGIAINDAGDLFISDAANHRVARFSPDGAAKEHWGGLGVEVGQFWKPQGLGIDSQGRVIVMDVGNHRAQLFTQTGESVSVFGEWRMAPMNPKTID